MLFADDVRVHHSGGRIKGIDSGIDTEFGKGSGQHGGSIQVSESGSGSRISEIISRHVNSLYRGNRTFFGGGNSFLEGTQIGSQSGLITDGRRDTSQQGRHFGTGLCESENVIDEKKHVFSFFISEVLGHGQTGQSHTGSSSWGFVHLSID